jgi:dolichol-phosphate mannosyltransferase
VKPLVSLVVPLDGDSERLTERLPLCRDELAGQGYRVEILVAGLPNLPGWHQPIGDLSVNWVQADAPGLAPAAVAGIRAAQGEAVVILDEGMGYELADIAPLIEPMLRGEAELVIGSRFVPSRGGWRALVGRLLKPVVGTSDPLSGLVGVRPAAFHEAAGRLSAVGSKFSFELLVKVEGRVIDAPVRRPHKRRNEWPSWDDLRHWKRLADHQYGNFSRLIQFCFVGASGMFVDLSSYALFQWLLEHTRLATQSIRLGQFEWPAHVATAAVVAVALALVWNFSLNRRLTFNDARGGSIVRQFFAYVLSNAVSVPLSLFLRLQLPEWHPFFASHRLAAAVVGIVVATTVSFSMARWIVFRRPKRSKPAQSPAVAESSAPQVHRGPH